MKALFIKEFRQGRPLLIFAAVMGVLLVAAYAAVGRFLLLYEPSATAPDAVAFIFGLVAAAMLPFVAIFASSGMFAGEAHGGTLPVLFGLPLSRLRVWAAMALAALALTAAGSVIVVTLTRLLLRSGFVGAALSAHLPDALCLAVFMLAVGIFCSSLARSVTAAIASTILLAGGLIGGAIALVTYYGAFLIGLPILDVALWCLFISPALLLGSARAVTKGELLTGFRKWLFSIPLTLFALALTVLVVCVVARAATPYRRASVSEVHWVPMPAGGRVLPLVALGDDIRFSAARMEFAGFWWSPTWTGGFDEAIRQPHGPIDWPVTSYAVALDLDSGKELYTARTARPLWNRIVPVAASPDGRMVAMIGPRIGLTYGPDGRSTQELRVYDTQRRQGLYRGTPEALKTQTSYDLSWSPTGRYLALVSESQGAGNKRAFRVLRPDGSEVTKRPIILGSACWSPTEDVIYGIDENGALCRLQPDGSTGVIWPPAQGSPKTDRWFDVGSISPDGDRIAVRESVEEPTPQGGRRRSANLIRLVDTHTGRSQPLWRGVVGAVAYSDVAGTPQWSSDGKALYLLLDAADERTYRQTMTRRFQLFRRGAGESHFVPVGPQVKATLSRLLVPPRPGEVLLWAWRERPWGPDEARSGRPRTLDEKLLVIAANGSSRSLPIPGGQYEYGPSQHVLGFDNRGRLLYFAGDPNQLDPLTGEPRMSRVEALDIDTGAAARVYP